MGTIMQDRTPERMSRIKEINISRKDSDTLFFDILPVNQGGEAIRDILLSPIGGFLSLVGTKIEGKDYIHTEKGTMTRWEIPATLKKYIKHSLVEQISRYNIPVNINI